MRAHVFIMGSTQKNRRALQNRDGGVDDGSFYGGGGFI